MPKGLTITLAALAASSAVVLLLPAASSSGQPRHTVGFPRYRVLLYNTTDRVVAVEPMPT